MAGLPPNYNFTNQYDPQLQASLMQQQQQQQQQQQIQQQPVYQHSQTQMQQLQQQQLQQQTYHQQQTQLIQQLHQEARDRRERIRSKPFPTNVTRSVRDRQARGKDVYRSSDDEKSDEEEDAHEEEGRRRQQQQQQHREREPILDKGNRNSLESVLDDDLDDDLDDGDDEGDTDNEADILRCCRAEDYETRQRRAFAASVLDRPEQLMMYALSEHDSIAGQRHRFMTIMCGYEEDEYWTNDGHRDATRRAAKKRANMRKAMSIDRRTA